jgi:ElaB/YqjD/DUF883 family membrane-anchored ribosome-binding protein
VDRMHVSHEQQNGESQFQAPALRTVADTADQLRRFNDQMVSWVRDRPLASVGIALGAGYLLGRVLSRWG